MGSLEIKQLLIFCLEAILVASLVLFLFRMRGRYSLVPLYITLGVFQPIHSLLASTLYLEILPGVVVSPGSAILFTLTLFVILVVYIFEDATEARKLVYGIMIANLATAVLLFAFAQQLSLQGGFNFYGLTTDMLHKIGQTTLYGTLVLFADTFLLILLYERCQRLLPNRLYLRLFLSTVLILIFDSMAFLPGAFYGEPELMTLLASGIGVKVVVALFYSLAFSLYLRFVEPMEQEVRSFRDILDLFSYREKLEIEVRRGQQTETLLRESEEKYHTLANISPVGIFRTDADGMTTYVNPRWCQISGLSSEEALGNGWLKAVHPDDLDQTSGGWHQATETRIESDAEYRFLRNDGSIAWVIGRAVPETNAEGQIIGYVGTITDITERKQAEAAIQDSEQRFRQLFHASPNSVLLLDPHDTEMPWVIVDCNTATTQMTGYQREELIGKSVYFLDMNRKTAEDMQAYLEDVRQAGVFSFETVQRHKSGSLYPVEVNTSIFAYGGRELVLGIDRDISGLKRSQAALQQRANELETLYQSSLEVNAQSNLDALLRSIVERAASLVGVDSGGLFLMQLDGQTLRRVVAHNSPDTPVEIICNLGEGLSGKVAQSGKMLVIPDYMNWEGRLPALNGVNFHRTMGVPLKVQDRVIGVITMVDRASEGVFSDDEIRLVSLFADQAAIAIENATLYRGLERSNIELATAYEATIEGWSRALDLRDKETEGHTLRVTELTLKMAQAMNVCEEKMVHIRRGALLHDIGKMGVPDRILYKPDTLTEDEWVIMRKHPVFAYEMLSSVDFLRPALDIPYCHHERWDGEGYPRNLGGKEIPLTARIFSVVDVWDALTSDRPYRPAWSQDQALEYIETQSGQHFDPQVVEVFLRLRANGDLIV